MRCNCLLGLVSINIGQWSEWHLVKCDTLASGYSKHQLGFIKNLSILSWMRLWISLHFVHVYLGPLNPISTTSHLSRQSLNISALFILTSLPPNLSSPARGLLKSPAIIHGLLWRLATLERFSHNTYLSTILGLVYTVVKIQARLEGSTLTSTWISCSVLARCTTSILSEFHNS